MMLLACTVLAGTAFAAGANPDPMQARVERMGSYYSKGLRSPEVFRALSGMGDPQIESAADAQYSRWTNASPEETEAAKQLFPDADLSFGSFRYDVGHCRPEAPIGILAERIKQFGANHPYVKQWIAVERVVLSACGRSPQKPASLPAPLVTNDAAIRHLQACDRAYQQASLLYYENDLPNALKAYGSIAADRTSPDRPLAVYMMAAIRAGSYADNYDNSKPMVPSAQSVKEVQAILADPSLASVHAIAAQLVGWIGAQESDEVSRDAQIHEALTALEAPLDKLKSSATARARYSAALTDITFLHHDFADEDWWRNGAVPDEYTASIAMARAAKTDPLAAWMLFPENPYLQRPWAEAEMKPSFPRYVAGYLGRRLSNDVDSWPHNRWIHIAFFEKPGLLDDSFSYTDAAEEVVDKEMVRVKEVGDDEALAALPFDFYNVVRLLWMTRFPSYRPDNLNNFAEALKRLQDFPFKSLHVYRDAVTGSLQYLITKGYLAEARLLRDKLHLDAGPQSERIVSNDFLIVLAEDENHLARVLNSKTVDDMSQYLQYISIEELWRLAARNDLPRSERSVFARTAWARLYALGRTIDANNDRLMRDLNPEMIKNWHSQPGSDVEPGNHVVLADVLATPGLNISLTRYIPKGHTANENLMGSTGIDHENHDDANWWCAWKLDLRARELDRALASDFGNLDQSDLGYVERTIRQSLFPALRESFVFRNYDQAELIALSKIDCAPKMLTARTIDWVKHPGWFDSTDLQPEALANAVAATHWGCYSQGSHAVYSREAFTLLHSKFPQSAAAKRTKYWYGCVGFGDCTKHDPLTTPSSH